MIHLMSLFKSSRAAAPRRPREPRSPQTEADWVRLRAPQAERDQVLSAPARAWLNALPAHVRPTELCARYPRVANRLALCWSDTTLTGRVLDGFLVDRRAKRKGFPPSVAAELLALRDLHANRPCTEDPEDQWALRLQAFSDRR